MLIQLSAPLCPTDLRARFVEFAGIFLTYACITVWWLWPSPASWPTHLFYASDDDISFAVLQRADSYLILWSLAWGARALTSNPWNLFNGNTFYPSPLSLAFSEHLLGYFPLFAPTYLITHNPVLAANVLTFLTYPLSGICMYAYARRHVGASAAFASGVAYAFYPARYLTPPHYHMLGVQYFPLILHALERWVESAKLRHAILLWVAITMQCLSSVYLMYAVALLLVVAVPFTAWSDRQKIDRRRIIGLAAALGAAVLVIAAAMYPYLVLQAHGLVPSYDSNRISLGLVPWISRIHVRRYLVSDGLGIAGYALAACGLLLGRLVDRGVARVLGATLFLYGIGVSLGPRIWTAWGELWSPYSTVQTIVPGFSTIRLPARFTIIAHLGASLLVGVGVAALGRSLPRMSALLLSVGAVIALLLPGLALPTLPSHPEAVGDDVPGVYRWLAGRDDGRAVLEIPQARDPAENSLRGYFSTFHWHPIVDGYAANAPLHRRYLHWIARRLPAEDALQELVDLADIGWLIVQRDALPEFARPLWNAPLPAGLTLVERWNETELYSVTRPPRENKRDRLLSDTRTIEGTQIAPIATPCSGSIELSRWIAAPLVAGEDARAVIKITNQSDETWPAFGFYPRGLVRLHGSLTDSTRHSVGDPIDPMIPSDLHPHRSVELQFQFKVPSSGAYSLRLELLQDSGMPLERCGTPPLVLELVVP